MDSHNCRRSGPGLVPYFSPRLTLRTRVSEGESSDRLNFGMFISHLPHVTTQSTHMLRTGGLTRRDRDFLLMLCSFPGLPFMAFPLHLQLCTRRGGSCASWELPFLYQPFFHLQEGSRYRGGRRVFRAASREQGIAS